MFFCDCQHRYSDHYAGSAVATAKMEPLQQPRLARERNRYGNRHRYSGPLQAARVQRNTFVRKYTRYSDRNSGCYKSRYSGWWLVTC